MPGKRAAYSIDDDSGLLAFAGHGPFGREMALIMSGFLEDARREQRERVALDEAVRPRSCRGCGGTFANSVAYAVHFEGGEGSRCLPGDAYGQLVDVDGVWVLAGSR